MRQGAGQRLGHHPDARAECDRFRAEHIGYVFQTFNLLRGFSALENVMLAMRFARLPARTPDRWPRWRRCCWTSVPGCRWSII